MVSILATLLFLGFLVVIFGSALQSVPTSEQRRRLSAQLGQWPLNSSVSFTGTTTTSSAAITPVSSTAGLQIGMTVTGPGLGAGLTIITIDSTAGGTVTLSGTATTGHAANPMVASFVNSSAQIHLYSTPYGGGEDPGPTDFTEAGFDGYTALDVTMSAGPYSNSDGTAEADLGLFSWVLSTTPVTGNLIYGYWIDYLNPLGGATRVVSVWENFPQPIPMNAIGQAVVCTVPMILPTPGSVIVP